MPRKKTVSKVVASKIEIDLGVVEVVTPLVDVVTPLVAGGVYRKHLANGGISEALVLCTKESPSGGKEGIINIFWEAPRMVVEGSDELNQWTLVQE